MGHTRPPYKIRLNPGGHIVWEGGDAPATIEAFGRHIATIHDQGPETMPNARLFRASPKLADLAELVQTILGTSLQADGSWATMPAHHKQAMYGGACATLTLLED